MHVSREVARRFLLGRQGLWPGRRWRGMRGTAKAMRAMGDLQLDPLQVVARAHDIALASRVLGYRPDDWAILAYARRQFFEAGGWLAVRPIEELPFYRVVMRRERDQPRIRRVVEEHAAAVDEMRAILATGREVVNRDFAIRLRDAAKKDANINALVSLDCFAAMMPLAAEDTLKSLKPYFASYL